MKVNFSLNEIYKSKYHKRVFVSRCVINNSLYSMFLFYSHKRALIHIYIYIYKCSTNNSTIAWIFGVSIILQLCVVTYIKKKIFVHLRILYYFFRKIDKVIQTVYDFLWKISIRKKITKNNKQTEKFVSFCLYKSIFYIMLSLI